MAQRRLSKRELVCLTIGMGGLQVVWVAIMAGGSPYLLSLGIPSAVVSLVWVAGPLCGTVLQPLVGYYSDLCTHRAGRRRPYIVCGTALSILCMNVLPWTSELARFACAVLGWDRGSDVPLLFGQVAAVFWVWVLNASLQPVQAGLRTLIVDVCPESQQAEASIVTSCTILLGSLVGYGAGFVKMPGSDASGSIRNAQFKGFCVIGSLCLGLTVLVTVATTHEKRLVLEYGQRLRPKVWHLPREIWRTARSLSPRVARVCFVQAFVWMAWFPFLFYGVTYLGRLYKSSLLLAKVGPPPDWYSTDLEVQSLRHGTLALVLFSCTALLTNVGLRLYITKKRPGNSDQDVGMLRRSWMLSHLLTSTCLLAMTLGEDFIRSTVFVSLLGVSWGFTQCIPYAIIGMEIAGGNNHDSSPYSYSAVMPEASSSSTSINLTDLETEKQHVGIAHHVETDRPKAATIMGIHNIAISLPQIASALISSVIFAVVSPLELGPILTLAWVLRVGVVAAAFAAYLSRKL